MAARVVSMPCMDLFFEQPDAYRRAIVGSAKVRVAVEAAVRRLGRYIGDKGPSSA